MAKSVGSLHALAGGRRVVLGASTSWQAEEYAALNVPFSERGRVLDETLAGARAPWRRSAKCRDFWSGSLVRWSSV
jgi:alkanesulfonate monooxygenase SsuD/methylene tetrahydromethanopterin reductase-like flavin-dependent oxidoreductase (luciferase family)